MSATTGQEIEYRLDIVRASDGEHAARGTILHSSSLVHHKQRQPSITRHGEFMGQSLALRPIPSEGFFVSREHHDFVTKIGKTEIDSKLKSFFFFFFREHDDF